MDAARLAEVAGAFERAYLRAGDDPPSWEERLPEVSLRLIERLAIDPSRPFADVGGGDGALVDALLARGFGDVTVVDLSATALGRTRARLGDDPRVALVEADVTCWRAERALSCWHDRACLHFLTEDADRTRYFDALRASLAPDGAVILGGFGPQGPERCSGLEVRRASGAQLAVELGAGFEVVEDLDVVHRTPWGAEQRFSWLAARRRS